MEGDKKKKKQDDEFQQVEPKINISMKSLYIINSLNWDCSTDTRLLIVVTHSRLIAVASTVLREKY